MESKDEKDIEIEKLEEKINKLERNHSIFISDLKYLSVELKKLKSERKREAENKINIETIKPIDTEFIETKKDKPSIKTINKEQTLPKQELAFVPLGVQERQKLALEAHSWAVTKPRRRSRTETDRTKEVGNMAGWGLL